MKKRILIFFLVVLALSANNALSHEGEEDEPMLERATIYPLSQMAVVGYGSVAFGILSIIIILFHKKMSELVKKVVFILLVAVVSIVTLYLLVTTLHLNIISETKGPVHWHADFELWVCGKEIKLKNPEGISNKQGTESVHAHNDNRIHIEGVLLNKKEASLGAFFHAVGGHFSDDEIEVPTDEGAVEVHDGNSCNGKPAKLYVFVNENLIESPSAYVIAPYEKVPPGDRIKIMFTERSIEEINPSIAGHHADTNNHILKVWDDGTAYVKGEVIDHISGCEVDGACKLVVQADNQKVALVYAEGDLSCLNVQPVSWVHWGRNVKKGTIVKAYGIAEKVAGISSNNVLTYELRFCDSKEYFILGENDPVPVGAYTEKFFDEVADRLQKVPKGAPMTEYPYSICDLDRDFNCDEKDLELFESHMGSCVIFDENGKGNYQGNYSPFVDIDGDNCVTQLDKEYFLEIMQETYKHGSMTTTSFRECDLDRDEDCDDEDIHIFRNVFDECDDGDNYNVLADADHNGCINELDEKILFQINKS